MLDHETAEHIIAKSAYEEAQTAALRATNYANRLDTALARAKSELDRAIDARAAKLARAAAEWAPVVPDSTIRDARARVQDLLDEIEAAHISVKICMQAINEKQRNLVELEP